MRGKSKKQIRRVYRRKGRKTRKQRGGEDQCDNFERQMKQLKMLIDRKIKAVPTDSIRFLLSSDIDLSKCSEKHFTELKDKLSGYPILYVKSGKTYKFNDDSLDLLFQEKNLSNAPDSFYEFFGLQNRKKRACSIEELMTLMNPEETCLQKNLSKVKGSCSEPSFFYKQNDFSDDTKRKYIALFDAIEAKLLVESNPKYFDLVLGSTTKNNSDFRDLENSYTLAITPIEGFKYSIDDILSIITSTDSLKNKVHALKDSFPLHYNKRPNNKAILDRVIEMYQKGIKVRITNRVCGSCFPSFYYLVKNGIEYLVSPEQGLHKDNTAEIRECFKKN